MNTDVLSNVSSQFAHVHISSHANVEVPLQPHFPTESADFCAAASYLWHLDSNRLVLGRDIQVNAGGLIPQGSSHLGKDFAPAPLFSFVAPHVWSTPTFACFMALLDNYEPRCGQQETVTDIERAEEAAFLNACIETLPLRFAHAWLLAKGLAPSDISEFRQKLWSLWFKLCVYKQNSANVNATCCAK